MSHQLLKQQTWYAFKYQNIQINAKNSYSVQFEYLSFIQARIYIIYIYNKPAAA